MQRTKAPIKKQNRASRKHMHKLKQRREDHSQTCLCLRCVETEHNINTMQECAMEFKYIAQLREPQTETQAALSKSHEVSPFLSSGIHLTLVLIDRL